MKINMLYKHKDTIMSNKIIFLRSVHGLFAVYFIACIFYIYYAAYTLQFNRYLGFAVLSLFIEGASVFLINHGDCPLIHIQRKIGDETPFFELFLPKRTAKKAIPFFLVITFTGLLLLAVRFIL